MGSGGPRGLQILLSVADRGRGGFDSHTFPPIFARTLAVALLSLGALSAVSSGARAQSPPDSVAAAPEAAAPTTGPTAPAGGERSRPWHAQPWAVMMRSGLLPGWGQFTNHRPLKAGIAIALEGVAGVRLAQAWNDLDDAARREEEALAAGDLAGAEAAQADYNSAYNRRATAGWVLALTVVVSMVDAYVDAHLLQFDADFGPDPKLPDDVTGACIANPEPRLSLRWSFTGP